MTDEPKKDHPEDIESILSDLDAILTDMGGEQAAAPSAAAPEAAPKAAPKVEIAPAAAPKPVEAPQAAAPPPPPPAPVEASKPVEVPKAAPPPPPAPMETPKANQVELAPRDGMIKPPEKKAPAMQPAGPAAEPPKPAPKLPNQTPIELFASPAISEPKVPPKPVEPPKPAEPPKAAEPPSAPPAPTAVPAPASAVPSTKIEELPAETPKEQIRRVAYIYTSSCGEVKDAFAAFLSQAARTISKKPLFLREVLTHEVGPASDPNAVLQKSLQVKAIAILAVVEGWPASKVDELSEACSRANVLFRSVAPADAQKKSTAVDVIVDMMLLPGEG